MRRGIGIACAGLALLLLTATASAAPLITYTIDGIAGTNGWYRGSAYGNLVIVRWTINVPVLADCPHAMPVSGPTTGATRTCTVTLTDGSTLTKSTGIIRIDADPPTAVGGRLTRAADFNGWYNHPVSVTWSGRDATSGIAGCSTVTYGGPARAGAVVRGGCADRAGNSAFSSVALNYDATPPVLTRLTVTSTAPADVVQWSSSSPSDRIVVQRAARGSKTPRIVFQGSGSSFVDRTIRPGFEYLYSVRAFDQAGNPSSEASAVGLPKVLTLRKTGYVPRAAPKPILRWQQRRGASYYHVQLFRRGKRVLAVWPTTHQLGLPGAWKWRGKRQRLGPGRYRWYVWAGFGRRSFARYHTVGSAQFIVPRR